MQVRVFTLRRRLTTWREIFRLLTALRQRTLNVRDVSLRNELLSSSLEPFLLRRNNVAMEKISGALGSLMGLLADYPVPVSH